METENKQKVNTNEIPVGQNGDAPEKSAVQDGNAPAEKKQEKEAAPKSAGKNKGKASGQKAKTEAQMLALEEAGRAAIEEHGFPEVYVTSDGTPFRQRTDALNHAANLSDKAVLTIKK